MSSKTLRFLVGVVGTAAAAIFAGPASAGYYGSHYDPPGTDFFIGQGVFLVPDPPGSPCLTLPEGLHDVNPGSEGCDDVALVTASTNASSPTGDASLNFAGHDTDIFSMILGSGEPLLLGINSGLIPMEVDSCSGSLCGFNWYLQWFTSTVSPEDLPALFTAQDNISVFNQVFLYQQQTECSSIETAEIAQSQCPLVAFSGGPALNVTFAQAPEPGTLALILGGLAAGWLSRKRKVAA